MPLTHAWAQRSMSTVRVQLLLLLGRPVHGVERICQFPMIHEGWGERMHNDIICQLAEVNVTRVVTKGDIPTALAGGRGHGSVQIAQPGTSA